MAYRIIKTALISLPLITACGRSDDPKERAAGPIKAPSEQTTQEEPVINRVQAQMDLRHEILAAGLLKKLITQQDYEYYIENDLVPSFDGKKRTIQGVDQLFNNGIFTVEDAFKDLDWTEHYDAESMAHAVLGMALYIDLIDRDQYQEHIRNKTVSIYYNWTEIVIPQDELLANWVTDVWAGFQGSMFAPRNEQ